MKLLPSVSPLPRPSLEGAADVQAVAPPDSIPAGWLASHFLGHNQTAAHQVADVYSALEFQREITLNMQTHRGYLDPKERRVLAAWADNQIEGRQSKILSSLELRQQAALQLLERGVVLDTKNNLPGENWYRLFMKEFGDRFTKVHGSKISRTGGHRLEAGNSITRAHHFDVINDIVEKNPIVMLGNSDETSLGSASIKEAMKSRALRGYLTKTTGTAHLPTPVFSSHTTFLATVFCMVKDLHADDIVVPDEACPGMFVFEGKNSAQLPTDGTMLKDVLCTIQPKGSVSLASFIAYILEVLIPYIERTCPGGLKKGEREVLHTFDLPTVHRLPSWVLKICADKGIHLYCFPHNSTHWSQTLDSRHGFGAFKPAYYDALDAWLAMVAACPPALLACLPVCVFPLPN